MMRSHIKSFLSFILATGLASTCLLVPSAWGQTSTTGGRLNVSVMDPTGGLIPNADLELKDLSTNDIRRGATQANGVFSFSNVPGSTYQLKVAAAGFAPQVFESVVVRTSL